MADAMSTKRPGQKILWGIGIGFTVLWGWFIAHTSNFSLADLSALSLNELGDFFAGVAAPLAFVWLVIGLLFQGHELKLQYKELGNSVEQFKKQTESFRRSEAYQRQGLLFELRRLCEQDLFSLSETIFRLTLGDVRQTQFGYDVSTSFDGETLSGDNQVFAKKITAFYWKSEKTDHTKSKSLINMMKERGGFLTSSINLYISTFEYLLDEAEKLNDAGNEKSGDPSFTKTFYQQSAFGSLYELLKNKVA